MSRRSILLAVAILAVAGVACSSSTPSDRPAAVKVTCDVPVDRFKELIVVEEAIIGDAISHNATNGPLSFRHVIEDLAGPGGDTSEFVSNWIAAFGQSATLNQYTTPGRPFVETALVCPWLRSDPTNGCDEGCLTCSARKLSLEKAPFRLMAVVNRFDVHLQRGAAGEGRLAFAVTQGPGDLPDSQPLEMSVIFEYDLPTTEGRDKAYWAKRWHTLGQHRAFDESFKTDLLQLVGEYVQRGNLSQARTNERVFDWEWELREFKLNGKHLAIANTVNTPDRTLNGADVITKFIEQNADAVLAGTHQLPPNLAGAGALGGVRWIARGVTEDLRKAFARETCNGCHQSETRVLDFNFHVSPFKVGVDRLSVFMNDPADPAADELARRTREMQKFLCD